MRSDADRLKNYLKPDAHVLIIGGGLLGLELSAALREVDVQVSILQLTSRLMERQIDNLAGQLLLDFIEEIGIAVYMSDQVLQVEEEPGSKKLSATFRSGKKVKADAIVYAVGTKPNIEFAQEAGIESARGIIVNDYLQTSEHFALYGDALGD